MTVRYRSTMPGVLPFGMISIRSISYIGWLVRKRLRY